MADWPHSTKRWNVLRLRILDRDNWRCQWEGCGTRLRRGRTAHNTAVVDHKVAAKDRPELAFHPDNLWSLCKWHHDVLKQSEERRGYSLAVGADGYPVDPRHPANRRVARQPQPGGGCISVATGTGDRRRALNFHVRKSGNAK